MKTMDETNVEQGVTRTQQKCNNECYDGVANVQQEV